jgi:hypothetical protein
LNIKQTFSQNHKTIEVLKLQNVVGDPGAIGKIEGMITCCKKLKDFKVIWNLRYFKDEPARSFKYSLFDIFDNTPSIHTFRIQVPDKCIERDGREIDGPLQGLIMVDIKQRLFYVKTGWSLHRPRNILPKTNKKSQIRKHFIINGKMGERIDTHDDS